MMKVIGDWDDIADEDLTLYSIGRMKSIEWWFVEEVISSSPGNGLSQ